MSKANKEQTVEEFNAGLAEEIEMLEAELKKLKSSYKSETLKPQATLQECIAMNNKIAKIEVKKDVQKPKTNSL
tara:strand:+ start:509 stop:730 length:222 start_codon:yes stop_codon:yes gene_type:complete